MANAVILLIIDPEPDEVRNPKLQYGRQLQRNLERNARLVDASWPTTKETNEYFDNFRQIVLLKGYSKTS